jgi:spermidine synthase
MLLFLYGTSATFAAMLASVLIGIALGGLTASRVLGTRPSAAEWAGLLAAGAGVAVVLTYAAFAQSLPPERGIVVDEVAILRLSLTLMLPTSWLSGMLFTFLGAALKSSGRDEAWAAGSLTLANTAGGAVGALAGGLVLIPRMGVERSFFALALAYGVMALLLPRAAASARGGVARSLPVVAGVAYLVVLALFPFGLMQNDYLMRLTHRPGAQVVAFREGINETLTYFRQDVMGTATSYRLVTNAHSMSGTGLLSRRYMRMFVDWPRAVHPGARRALLICFGVGTTAQALVDTRSLEQIDVVDISRDVLEMGRVVFEGRPYPLDDPRVRVHVEDGRFFLLTTDQRFDVITAEPPPLKYAGITNLYSREFFRLVFDRLAPGGVVTYWLPVYQATPRESRGIVAAFCDAFTDCSLWTGSGGEWMLAGTRGAQGPGSEAAFSRPWSEAPTAAALRDSGFESPEQLGATFLADGEDLESWVAGALPLDDDHPGRLGRAYVGLASPFMIEYARLMNTREARRRFAASANVARLWPEGLRERTLLAFDEQVRINAALLRPYLALSADARLADLASALTGSRNRMPVLWLMGSGVDEQRAASAAAARGESGPALQELLGIEAMAARDYRRAEQLLAQAEPFARHAGTIRRWRILALALAGDLAAARELLPPASRWTEGTRSDAAEWQWLSERLTPAQP